MNYTAVTPVNEDCRASETLLPDLVINIKKSSIERINTDPNPTVANNQLTPITNNQVDANTVSPLNTNEFDFPALSSED